MRAIDLFAGAGGFTQGAVNAGLDVVLAANHWPDAVAFHEANHPGTEHACQDVRQMDFSALPDFDVLLASPACQGHSEAGRGSSTARAEAKHEADRNTALAVIECADRKRPGTVIVENVARFTRWRLFDWWCDGLRLLGYHVTHAVVDAADLGVPQNRRRVIITASLEAPVDLPKPSISHAPVSSILGGVDEGWARVSSKPVGVRERVARGRENHGSRFLTQHVTRHPGRSLDRPIGTVTCASMHWHLVDGAQMRPLTTRELARAQCLPDSWELPVATSTATRLIGNAIPPVLAQWAIGHAVRAA